jgi:hypothetical protein
MLVFPAGLILIERLFLHSSLPIMFRVGKWYVFWSAGVRLFAAGLRQYFQPRFTSQEIFHIKSDDALPLVRELGIANFATGTVGILSLAKPTFVPPVAIAAAIFYGVAGFRHIARREKSENENIAMISDVFAFLLFASCLVFIAFA